MALLFTALFPLLPFFEPFFDFLPLPFCTGMYVASSSSLGSRSRDTIGLMSSRMNERNFSSPRYACTQKRRMEREIASTSRSVNFLLRIAWIMSFHLCQLERKTKNIWRESWCLKIILVVYDVTLVLLTFWSSNPPPGWESNVGRWPH